MKAWRLDGTDLLVSSSSDEGSLVVGVLGESVVSLCESGRIRISHPVSGTQTVETQLENLPTSLTLANSVTLPKHGKALIVSEEGFLYQVCLSHISHPVTKYIYSNTVII